MINIFEMAMDEDHRRDIYHRRHGVELSELKIKRSAKEVQLDTKMRKALKTRSEQG